MGKEFSITPRVVPRVETKHRRIISKLPHPDSIATLEKLRQFEPQSMRGQPPLVWDRAEDIYVYDKYGNKWLDWSSGVLVTNCGHGAPEVRQAIIDQVPFPDGYWTEDTSFEFFLAALEKKGLPPENVAGVMFETYQGVGPDFAPVDYIRQLAAWCKANGALLIFDEVQAGFARTGKFWAFEHYGVTPDVICCGKGITSSLPLSAVIGRANIMDQFPPGSMTSTHTGNPVCFPAALANLKKIVANHCTAHAARVGE